MANNILTQATVIALTLIVSANSLDIDVQPEFVQPNDENVVFTCSGGNNSSKMLEMMSMMRLMKLDNDDHWTEVAVLRYDGSIDLTTVNVTAVGRLGNVLESYLAVTWPVAPDDIYGRYRCDAIAVISSGDIVSLKSRVLEVKGRPSDLSLFSSLLSKLLKNSEERLLGKVNETMHKAMKSALHSMFGDLKVYLDNRTAVIDSNRRPEEEVETMQWPEGNFMLVMPSDGCPLLPPAWNEGFIKMKAPPKDKYYPIDVPLHLANPHKENGFIYRQYCALSASSERTQSWPAGSYCVYKLGNSCPTGFKNSEATIKVLSDPDNFFLFYSDDRTQHGGGTFSHFRFHFCCRHDGTASNPIDLPVSDPFYLLRHRGRCQEVKGMDVTQDVFMMETVDDVDHDKWLDDNPDFRPDVSFKPNKENLCYYSRRRG